jgi:hypothetical protein
MEYDWMLCTCERERERETLTTVGAQFKGKGDSLKFFYKFGGTL